MASKLIAAGTVRTAGEPVLIANGKTPNIITDLLEGKPLGTLIVPQSKRLFVALALDRFDGQDEGVDYH